MEPITFAVGFGCLVVGVIAGALVYRNNAKKIEREFAEFKASAISKVDAVKADAIAEYEALKSKLGL